MIYTVERLRELCPKAAPDLVKALAPALEEHAPPVLTTRTRRAHFLGQIAHESAGFTRMLENLNYSAERIQEVWKHRPSIVSRAAMLSHNPIALANAVYANRMGNGDESSGDGYRYRGRGLIQLTGRDNYREAGVALKIEMIGGPDQALEPATAVRIALWFWTGRNCNAPADRDDVETVTRLINGGVNGLAERRVLTKFAGDIFEDESLIA